MVCQKLRKQPEYFITDYSNPFPKSFEDRDDDTFIKYFFNSLYPLERTIANIQKHYDMFSYLSESLFTKQTLFFVFLHENFARQSMHRHDYFEIVYTFRGQCTLQFESSSIKMTEGNVCIIAPQTLHEAFVLDKESFVVNFSMTKEAFESAFSTVFLRRDLVSSYIHTILYQEDMPNYLFIPSGNSKYIKDAAKHIIYEERNNSSYSSSFCVSWLSVFICSVLGNYQSDIQIYNDEKNSAQAERMAMLEYIQNNFRTVSLDSVAECFNYNKSYLSRLITQLTGKSFKDIITEMKLKAGCELLENTDFSLEQISELIGYKSGDYFSKAFKKAFNISAAKYRENHMLTNAL